MLWWRRGRVELHLKHGRCVLPNINVIHEFLFDGQLTRGKDIKITSFMQYLRKFYGIFTFPQNYLLYSR